MSFFPVVLEVFDGCCAPSETSRMRLVEGSDSFEKKEEMDAVPAAGSSLKLTAPNEIRTQGSRSVISSMMHTASGYSAVGSFEHAIRLGKEVDRDRSFGLANDR